MVLNVDLLNSKALIYNERTNDNRHDRPRMRFPCIHRSQVRSRVRQCSILSNFVCASTQPNREQIARLVNTLVNAFVNSFIFLFLFMKQAQRVLLFNVKGELDSFFLGQYLKKVVCTGRCLSRGQLRPVNPCAQTEFDLCYTVIKAISTFRCLSAYRISFQVIVYLNYNTYRY